MKKKPYKIITYILGALLIITLFFLLDATKNPPGIKGSFSSITASDKIAQPDRVDIAFAMQQENAYRIYFQSRPFDRGIFKKSADNTYILKPKTGANGILIITNKKSYLYYPKLKEKIIVVEQTTTIK